MRTDYEILREIIGGFSDPAPYRPPTAWPHGARAGRWTARSPTPSPRRLTAPTRTTCARPSSGAPRPPTTRPSPWMPRPFWPACQAALAEGAEAWSEEADVVGLEPFVLLLRARGARPGVYRVGPDGADLVREAPSPEEIEGMTVQKEFARAGAIVSMAADLDRADAWAGAHGYRHAMARAAAVIYSVHLRSAARGLAGTVFAGLSPSTVRRLLDSDGVSRHQMLAVTVAVPARAAPSS